LRHECPSDHHTYAWGSRNLVCTSYADERERTDTITVNWGGRTYWCHTGAPGPAASTRTTTRACGVERWRVKTLSDTTARLVTPTPRRTMIAQLVRVAEPPTVAPTTRAPGPETTLFTLRARLVELRQEDDGDIHLVIADPRSGATMIAEFPADYCGTASESFRSLRGTAEITGVGFFDAMHGQTGVAPNGIELHPVLRFSGSCGA
jgi:hypothetical protein